MDPLGPAPRLMAQFVGGLAAGIAAPRPGPAPAPGLAPGQAPGPVDRFVPPAPPRAVPFLPDALQPEPFFQAHDKWLIPLIVAAAVSVFLGLAATANRWARQMGVPIRD